MHGNRVALKKFGYFGPKHGLRYSEVYRSGLNAGIQVGSLEARGSISGHLG